MEINLIVNLVLILTFIFILVTLKTVIKKWLFILLIVAKFLIIIDFIFLFIQFMLNFIGLTRSYSPGLIVYGRKIAMQLTLSAMLKIWFSYNQINSKDDKKILLQLSKWFEEGFINLYEQTKKTKTFSLETNSTFARRLERLIINKKLDVTITTIHKKEIAQPDARLMLVPPWAVYYVVASALFGVIFGNPKFKQRYDFWREKLDIVELKVTIK